MRSLRRRPEVRFAERDHLMRLTGTPNDPSFGLQWAFRNTGQLITGVSGTPGADVRAVPAWDVSTGSRSIVVGVTDTGMDYRHPDLAANVWSNPGGIGGCAAGTHGYNVLASSCDPMDDDTVYGGHGTHVAGIAGAVGDNSVGVTGVNWSTTLLPVKWVSSGGAGLTSQLIAALDWLVQAKQAGVNVRVVNDSTTFVGTAYSQALSDQIDVLGANDILFVTAAGNTGKNNDNLADRRYPCGYGRPTEICVAASDQNDRLPSWANYGPNTVDLAAPGDNVYSTVIGGGYGYIDGSSMAAPQVAGAAALMLAKGSMSASALKAGILGNVDVLPSLSGLVRTGGRLNVCKALPGCGAATPTAPTFGTTSVGTLKDVMVADRKRVNRYSLTAAGSVTKLSAYLEPTGTPGQQAISGVLYADAAGAPGRLVTVTRELTFRSTDTAGWYDLPLAAPVSLAPGNYWIGLMSGNTSRVAGFRWTSASGSRAVNGNIYTSGASDPFGSATVDGERMSVFATFAPVVGKATVGANADSFAADRKRVNRYTLASSGRFAKARLYLAPTAKAGQQALRAVVYADAGGAPGALAAVTNELVFRSTDAAGWYEMPFSTTVTLPAGDYWIGVLSGSTAGVAGYRYDSVSASRLQNANPYGSGASDPFGAVGATDSQQMSIQLVPGPA
jgi:subtilisin family serine protease